MRWAGFIPLRSVPRPGATASRRRHPVDARSAVTLARVTLAALRVLCGLRGCPVCARSVRVTVLALAPPASCVYLCSIWIHIRPARRTRSEETRWNESCWRIPAGWTRRWRFPGWPRPTAPRSSPSPWTWGRARTSRRSRERALATGAVNAYVVDVREEFARDYILPALQAGAIYEDRYPLATALGRPLIAKKLVEVAHLEKAGAIAHGCTGKGNDQVRLDVSARALDPAIKVYRPGARVGHDARRRDRVRAGAGHSGAGHEGEPLQHRREPVGPVDRVRHARGSRGRSRPRTSSR